MFGFSKRERLQREVETLRLQEEAQNLRAKIQNAGTVATYPLSDPLAFEKLFGPMSNAVSPDTALKHSAVYRCTFLIGGSISMLPFGLFELQADGHRKKDTSSPLAKLIDKRPNARLSASMFWRSIVSDMLLNGNGVAWIERKSSRSPEPVALHYVPWARTGVRLDNIAGQPVQVYTMTLDDGRLIVAHQDDVLHIPGSAQWQIFRAMSPLTAYAMSVGIGISADAFAKAYFDNGSTPDGYITYPNSGKNGQADEIRKHWMSKHGGENRFAGPAVLTEGGKFEPIHINAADAQLLDSRRYSVEDIARIFGVPPHLVGQVEKATSFGKGLEEQTQSFVDFTLGPHLQAIEDEVNAKLVRSDDYVAEFDREAFVRGDLKTRMEAFQIALGGNNGPGVMTPNEVRQKLNMGPANDPNANELVTWTNGAAQVEPDSGGAQPSEETAPEPSEVRRAIAGATEKIEDTKMKHPPVFAAPHSILHLLEKNRHAPIANARQAKRGFWIGNQDPDTDGDVDDPNKTDEDSASVYVYDVIGSYWGVSAQQFVPAIAALKSKTIHLHINSPGGDVFEARAIKTALEQHPSRVVAHIDGLAASAASFLMMAADEIAIAPGAFVMIHNPWGFAVGDANDMRSTANLLDQIAGVIVSDYLAKTGIPSAELATMMEEETWMDADTAIAKKFCDRLLSKPAKASTASTFDLSAYVHAPDALQAAAAAKIDDECETARQIHARLLRVVERQPA